MRLRSGNTAPFEEMLRRWRAVCNTVSDLTEPRFELQTFRYRDERVTARPISQLHVHMNCINFYTNKIQKLINFRTG